MKKRFVVGAVFVVLSLLFCGVASLCFCVALQAKDIGGAVLAIVLLPIAVACYAMQAITCIVGEGALWGNFRRDGYAKKASLILAIIGLCALAAAVGIVTIALLTRG